MAGTCLREGELRFGKAGKPGHDEWRRAYPRTYPRAPILLYHPPTSSAQGSLREAFVEAGRWQRRLRASFATRHSGGAGAPPGITTNPCQELADDLGVALPASGLLERDVLRYGLRPS